MAELHTSRVNVICAPPNGRNPGMTSVDLAFDKVARLAGLTDVTYWRLWDVSEWREYRGAAEIASPTSYVDPGTGITYQSLRGRMDEVLSADRVVYWGDFMHMAVHQRHMVDVLSHRIGLCSVSEAEDIVAQAQLLRGADDESLGRVVSYGSTLSMNTWRDYASPYALDLERFVSRADRVWFRDPYSAQIARTIRGPERGVAQGLDSAFLLHDGSHHGGAGLGVFIGRSAVRPEVAASFGRQLTQKLHMPATWIPWGIPPAFWPVDRRRRFRAAWPALEREEQDPTRLDLARTAVGALRGTPKSPASSHNLRDLIYGVGEFDVVLTDTYHLAINSWAQGVPAVCLVDRGGPEWSVNSGDADARRDKRVDLYSQLDALGLIVDLTDLGPRISREVDRIADLLGSPEMLAVVMEGIAAQRRQSTDAIVSHLR